MKITNLFAFKPILFGLALGIASCIAPSVYAGTNAISTGVVYPANNGALSENPASLVQSDYGQSFSAGSGPVAELNSVGSSDFSGYGLGVQYFGSSQLVAVGGLSFGSKSTSLGVNARYLTSGGKLAFSSGIFVEGSAVSFGLVAKSFPGSFSFLIPGVGTRLGNLLLELDAWVSTTAGLVLFSPALAYQMGAFTLGGGIWMGLNGASSAFRAGLHYWLNKSFSFEALYNYRLSEFLLGVRFKL